MSEPKWPTNKPQRIEVISGLPFWMKHAECRDLDTEMFFVKRGSRPTDAIKLCETCPVKQECRDYADANGISEGVWGGENRSRPLRRRRST